MVFPFLKKEKMLAFLLPVLLLTLNGCVYVVIGSVGALGGYIISPDTVEGIVEYEHSEVWDSAVEIVSIMGTISEKNDQGAMLIAKIAGAKVTVSVITVSSSVSKLTVKARRAFFPKINLAQEIYGKISANLSE